MANKLFPLVFFLYSAGCGVFWIALTLHMGETGLSYSEIGFVLAVPAFTSISLDAWIGGVLDKKGRKSPIIYSFLATALVSPFFPQTSSFLALCALSFLFGVFSTVSWVAAVTYAIDTAGKEKPGEKFGSFSSSISLGEAVAPLAGAFLLINGLKQGFWGYSAVLLLVSLLALKLPATMKKKPVKEKVKNRAFMEGFDLFKKQGTRGVFLLSSMFILAVWDGMVWMIEPLLIDSLTGDIFLVGIILALLIAPVALSEYVFGKISDRIDPKKLMMLGLFTIAFSGIALSTSHETEWIIGCAVAMSLGVGMASPTSLFYLSKLCGEKNRGAATGFSLTIQDSGYLVGPFLAGTLSDAWGLPAGFLMVSLLALPVLALGAFSGRKELSSKKPKKLAR